MTNLPDIPRWLASVAKIDWLVLAALVAFSAVLLWLNAEDPSWFSPVPPEFVWIVWVVLLLSVSLLLSRGVPWAVVARQRHQQGRVHRKFSQLSDKQQALLLAPYERGHRRFTRPGDSKPRWLEQLEEWNYIEWRDIWYHLHEPFNDYVVTKQGWQELERIQNKFPRRTEQ